MPITYKYVINEVCIWNFNRKLLGLIDVIERCF
jgi:hypothetical protein